jgi:tight adherence protein C
MNPLLIVGVVAIMALVPILAWSFLPGLKSKRVDAKTLIGASAGNSAIDYRTASLQRSAKDRAIAPAFRKLVEELRKRTPKGWSEEMEMRIAMAGMNASWSSEKVLVLKAVGLVVGAFLSYWFFQRGLGSKLNKIGTFGSAPLGFFLPDIIIKNKADKRQELIQKQLPDILDQITVGVEAGLGFDSAMARSAKSTSGPLPEELARTLQHVSAGLSRAEAMRGLANRNKVPELRQFVGAILQAEQFGIPMAQVLRVQAVEQRRRRRQRAEEKAMKLPVKVLFPLVLCILPALFIVLIGPAALSIKDANFG